MSNEIIVPSLGESVTKATVSRWLKKVGETVESDEPLVELETDKVNVEVPSPLSGTLSSIKVKEGITVEVGALLGVVQQGESKAVTNNDTQTTDQEQKSYASQKKISKKNRKLIIIAGNEEIQNKKVILKDLSTGEQHEIQKADLFDRLKIL